MNDYITMAKDEMAAWIIQLFKHSTKYGIGERKPLGDVTGSFEQLMKMVQGNFGDAIYNAGRDVFKASCTIAMKFLGTEYFGSAFLGAATSFVFKACSYVDNLAINIINALPTLNNYLNAIQLPRMRQYWSLYQGGYISQDDLLAYSGTSSMLEFYQKIGADPNFVGPVKTARQNRQITDAQLVQRMGLNNVAEVNELFGTGWRIMVDLNDELNENGIDVTYDETKEFVENLCADLRLADEEDIAIIERMVEKMQDLGMDELSIADISEIIEGAVEKASPEILEMTKDILIIGTDGADILEGTVEDNALRGMAGDDILRGNGGNDYYFYELGDGNDIIENQALDSEAETDRLFFGEGITPESVTVQKDGNDVLFQLGEGSVRVRGWFADEKNKLDEIVFKDGTSWDADYIEELLEGSEEEPVEPDPTSREARNEAIWLYESNGKNKVEGSDGADALTGSSANDAIRGGAGNDVLSGNGGDDVYFYSLGDGHDVIENRAVDHAVETDRLVFGADIRPEDLTITKDGNDLLLQLEDGSVRIKDWFDDDSAKLDAIVFEDGTTWDTAYLDGLFSASGPEPDPEPGLDAETIWLRESEGKNVLIGTDEGETLTGTNGDDALRGDAGNDRLYGGNGDDVLYGGKGDDYLEGGRGNDTYIWGLGDGNDTINENYSGAWDLTQTGTLKLGAGISPENIELTRSGNNLVFIIGESGERIMVQNWYSHVGYQLTHVEFADGTVWTRENINSMPLVFRGTDGNDTISTYANNDIIYGGDGNDRINAGDGDDVIYGGKGDDYLQGGRGNDVYVWDLGDGNDTINENYSGAWDLTQTGTLRLGEGIAPENVELTRSGSDLIFIIGESGERITVQSWYSHVGMQLTHVEFADGTVWTKEDVNAMPLVFRGTDGNDTVTGYDSNDILYGGKGNDYLKGGRGNDIYVWNLGDGNDTIDENYSGSWDLTQTGTLRLGAGVDPDNVEVTRSGSHLIFTIGETGEQIKVQNWYSHVGYKLTHVEFSDGTVWTTEDVEAVENGTYVKPLSVSSMQTMSFSGVPSSTDFSLDSLAVSDAYDAARLKMDIAIAGLSFETQDSAQVVDLASSAAAGQESVQIFTPQEEDVAGKHFEEKVS